MGSKTARLVRRLVRGSLLMSLALASGCEEFLEARAEKERMAPPSDSLTGKLPTYHVNLVVDPERSAGSEKIDTRYFYSRVFGGGALIERITTRAPVDARGRYVMSKATITKDRMLIGEDGNVEKHEGDPRIAREYLTRAESQYDGMDKTLLVDQPDSEEPLGEMERASRHSHKVALENMRSSIATARRAAAQVEGPGWQGGAAQQPVSPMDLPTPAPAIRPPHIDMPPT